MTTRSASPLASSAGQYCLGIRNGGHFFIIGDTTMRNYYLVFDLEKGRIGWGEVNRDPKGGCGSIDKGEVRVGSMDSDAVLRVGQTCGLAHGIGMAKIASCYQAGAAGQRTHCVR